MYVYLCIENNMFQKNSKNRFKLRKILFGPFILPFLLICSYFSFGLAPAKATSNSFEVEQSCKSDKNNRTTDLYKTLISDEAMGRYEKNWVKKNGISNQIEVSKIKFNSQIASKKVLKGKLEQALQGLNANPLLTLTVISGGCLSAAELYAEIFAELEAELDAAIRAISDREKKKLTWLDLLIKNPIKFLLQHTFTLMGVLITVSIIYYSFHERKHLLEALKKMVELAKKLEFSYQGVKMLFEY
jgi:hypothetical protein